jgi:hypothetical protein
MVYLYCEQGHSWVPHSLLRVTSWHIKEILLYIHANSKDTEDSEHREDSQWLNSLNWVSLANALS